MEKDCNKIYPIHKDDTEERTARVTAFNRETYGERIRMFRVARGLTQPKLAAILHTSRNYVSNWEIGRARPDMNMVPALCDALGITVAQFFGRTEQTISEKESEVLENYNRLDVRNRRIADGMLRTLYEVQQKEKKKTERGVVRVFRNAQCAAAGTFNLLDADRDGEFVELYRDALTEKADEIVIVSGDSMEPTFSDGDALLVQRTETLREGEIGIVIVNGDGLVKEFRGDGVYSHNARKYPFRRFEPGDDVRCFGRVLGRVEPHMVPEPAQI